MVARRHEAVGFRDPIEPLLELALVQLDDLMAARADEVMVVSLAAEAVAELTGMM